MKNVAADGVTVEKGNVVPLKRRTKPEPAQPQQVELPEGFKPLHPAEFAARMPGAQSGEFGETLARVDGREPIFCPECRAVHAPGNVARCRHVVEQRIVEGVAAKLAQQAAPPGEVALTPALIDAWLASIDGSTEAGTRKEYRRVALVQWVPFFGTLDAVGTRVKAYTNDRLKRVSKSMHKKELSALRGFLAWAEEQGHIAEAPSVPAPPRKATGTHSATRKTAPVSVSEQEIERIIALLPEWTRARRGADRHRVRDVFVLAWETGLRPITIGRLSVPEHWRPGMRELNITANIDKARFGRPLPLTPRAIEVLERCAPQSGLVFGRHDYRALLKNAARAAGLDADRAKHFSKYDFRHNRADFLLDQGADLRAVAYNHGHKLLSTTDKYLRPSKKGAEAMLAKVAGRSGGSSGASSASGACSCTPDGVLDEVQATEYPSLPTRTWRNWQTHQIQVLAR